jgi:hypothetical protein
LFEIDLDSPPRVSVEARLLDDVVTSDNPATLEIVATNGGDKPIRWQTGTPKPFGIQVADDLVLWTEAYEEHGAFEDGKSVGGSDEAVATTLDPGGRSPRNTKSGLTTTRSNRASSRSTASSTIGLKADRR